MAPQFSIVIPTRDRPHIVGDAIRSALTQTSVDFEIVVSDNPSRKSAEAVVQSFDDPRIRYFRAEREFSMPDNWEFALGKARGQWVTYLEDDNVFLPRLLEKSAEALRRFDAQVVAFPCVDYYPRDVSDVGKRNAYVRHRRSGEFRYVKSADTLRDHFSMRFEHDGPRMLNSMCHRDVIAKVKSRVGRFFSAPAPDFTSCVATLGLVDGYAYVDNPLFMTGGRGTSPHANPGSFKTFLSEFGEERIGGFTPYPMPYVAPYNIIAESVCRMQEVMPAELAAYPVDADRCLEMLIYEMVKHRAMGFRFEKEMQLVRSYFRKRPLRTQARSGVRLANRLAALLVTAEGRKVAMKLPFILPLAEKLAHRAVVKGDGGAFQDILGAARHLDQTLFGPLDSR